MLVKKQGLFEVRHRQTASQMLDQYQNAIAHDLSVLIQSWRPGAVS